MHEAALVFLGLRHFLSFSEANTRKNGLTVIAISDASHDSGVVRVEQQYVGKRTRELFAGKQ